VPQPPKLYGLPKLHKPNIPMRPIVSLCGFPTYQLSKYLTTVLKHLTDESRHKLQSTENFRLTHLRQYKYVTTTIYGKMPFLDCLVTRDNNKLRTINLQKTDTYRQTTRPIILYNPTTHKATTIRTLTRRAQLVCDSPDSLTDEIKYLDNVFNENNYSRDFIRHNT